MKKKKILIVISEYYKKISSNLMSDAINHLKKNKRFHSISTIIKVPGVFEIPVVIANNSKKYDEQQKEFIKQQISDIAQ